MMFSPFFRPSTTTVLFATHARRVRQAGMLVCCLGLYGPAHALDVNQATVDQLEALRGLGAKTAALIVKERARGGPYESMDNLAERVKGLGVKKARVLEAAGLRAGPSLSPASTVKPSPAQAGIVKPGAPAGAQAQPRARRPMQAPAATPGSR
ncbi:MAG: DUF655 domain-containing protein [Comamonadaceae bacterium]|nr:MAG: DUF655 domain-containing protein [Comamonadaceae bacterium]